MKMGTENCFPRGTAGWKECNVPELRFCLPKYVGGWVVIVLKNIKGLTAYKYVL